MTKKFFLILLLVACSISAWPCTSAIVSGRLTANGRPLLWKHRDTDELNNRVKAFPARDGHYAFVGLLDATDFNDTAVWMGYNEKGFAIMNTASYNLDNDPSVKVMDREGELMRLALQSCATVDEFEAFLHQLPKPMRVQANFGVIDALGCGAYFEVGNWDWEKYDLKDAPEGILYRTNYSHHGAVDQGMGYIREETEKTLLAPHVAAANITPAVFTEELSKTFYHSLLRKDFTCDTTVTWLVEQDFISRYCSSATTVIEGVLPGENPLLTTMWIGLGYPPCAETFPVWLWEGGVPECLQGAGKDNHAPQCDVVMQRKDSVFSIRRGNGQRYFNKSRLYNAQGTGYCQLLIPKNMETYRKGYEEIERHRKMLSHPGKRK